MAGNFKRGGGPRGGFKKSFSKKRAAPDDDDTSRPATSKKSKDDGDDDTAILVPKLEKDEDKNSFIALKANGTRRITISDFKGKTLVSIREYYEDDSGQMKPGKKGISLTIEQYNAFLAAAPLLETVLVQQREEKVVRPDYDAEPAVSAEGEKDEEDKASTAGSADDDEEA